MRAVLALLTLVLAACASTVDTGPSSASSTTGSGGSGTGGGSGGAGAGPTCPSTGDAGGPPSMCVESWECAAPTSPPFIAVCSEFAPASWNGGPLPPDLPLSVPPDGSCCTIEGLVCGGYQDCGPICRCKGGAFTCATPSTCAAFVCPTDAPTLDALAGQPCDHIGMFCPFMGCGPSCTCMLDPATGGPTWRCTTPPC